MVGKFPFVSRTFFFLVGPAVVVAIALYLHFRQSVGIEAGNIGLGGLANKVVIGFDTNGIPSIRADSEGDAYLALGFLHAQNRLWQMDVGRKIASGSISEYVGAAGVVSDTYMRTLGLRSNAEKMVTHLSARDLELLDRYVSGVNQGIEHLRVFPPEYQFLQIRPAPWTAVDSMLLMQSLYVTLSSNMAAELERISLVNAFGIDKTNDLMPYLNRDIVTDLSSASLVPENYQQAHRPLGSNSWVVSGLHTASGKPLLANDPHLSNSLPSTFYIANLFMPGLSISGATFPGLPFVAIGRNQNVAWGLTNMMADTQDVYVERVNPSNEDQYFFDGRYHDMAVKVERINVRSNLLEKAVPPLTIRVKRTHRGPVFSHTVGDGQRFAYSLRWTADDDFGGTFSSFLKMNRATNWEAFNNALTSFVGPIHNIVYADVEGNIGSVAPGAYPVRNHIGSFPSAGWNAANDWRGWLTSDQWPRLFNPPSGIIVAANNDVLEADYPFYVTSDWDPGFRAKRITEELRELSKTSKLDVFNMVDLQLDTEHPDHQRLVTLLMSGLREQESRVIAGKLLADWDGDMSAKSAGATLFVTWLFHLQKLLIEDEALLQDGDEAYPAADRLNLAFLQRVLLTDNSNRAAWCDYTKTKVEEDCQQIIAVAFERAKVDLSKRHGGHPEEWVWGQVHIAEFPHFPFNDANSEESFKGAKVFASLFSRRYPGYGTNDTVNVGSVEESPNAGQYRQLHGAVYRQIIDINASGISMLSLAGGQSGNVLSRHYDDLLRRHVNGKYISLPSSEVDAEVPLVLLPLVDR